MDEVARLCDVVSATTTSAAGCDKLRRDANNIRQRYGELCEAVDEALGRLDKALSQATEAETALETAQTWLNGVEQQLRDVQLKATLEEKQQQLAKVKVTFAISLIYRKGRIFLCAGNHFACSVSFSHLRKVSFGSFTLF